jgi:beta-N-acetylhexosaminidase
MKNINMNKFIAIITLLLGVLPSFGQPGEIIRQSDSLDIKIGQMIMVGYNGTSLKTNDPIIDEIKNGSVGGVILFEKNIADSNSALNLKRLISGLQAEAEVPLIIAIDQEGGTVNRLKSKYGFPESVTAAYLGELDNEDSTRYYARQTATTLANLGFNVNFAPVLDLASNPNNPIIAKYGRAYSADPQMVTKHAAITIAEHTRLKVITVGKHFPGHGSSLADTHLGMADVTDTWDISELYPYKALIKTGALKAVMSAHIVNMNLDPEGLPGTLSRKILHDILRQDLGFKGVVFSDDMQMQAITEHYGLEKAIELGINAGLDVIIFSNNIQNSEERTVATVHNIIKKLVNDGKIQQSRIDESYHRIIKLKKAFVYD